MPSLRSILMTLSVIAALTTSSAAARAPHRGPVVVGQLALPTAGPLPAASGLLVTGIYVTAPIVLDGVVLFRVAAPINAPVAQLPIGTRVADVQAALGRLVAESGGGLNARTDFDPATLRVHVKREGDVAVLLAADTKHSDPVPVVTITSVDAQSNGTDVDTLAAQWQSTLQSALIRALEVRQPAVEKRSLERIARVAIALVAISLLVLPILRFLWQRMERLESRLAERTRTLAAAAPESPEQAAADARRRRFVILALRELAPAQRLSLYGAIAETIVWALVLAWFISVTWSLSLFAETSPLAEGIIHAAIGIVTTIIITGLLNRILDIVISRAATAWRLRRTGNSEDRARLLLRIPTISRAVAGAKTFVLIFIAVLSVFGQIGVPIGSVVTIGGLGGNCAIAGGPELRARFPQRVSRAL